MNKAKKFISIYSFFFQRSTSIHSTTKNQGRNFPGLGGAEAQSVERATPGEEVPGSIPAVAARSLLVGSVSV